MLGSIHLRPYRNFDLVRAHRNHVPPPTWPTLSFSLEFFSTDVIRFHNTLSCGTSEPVLASWVLLPVVWL